MEMDDRTKRFIEASSKRIKERTEKQKAILARFFDSKTIEKLMTDKTLVKLVLPILHSDGENLEAVKSLKSVLNY